MKKISVVLVVLIGILSVVSCDSPSNPGGTGQEGGLAKVIIPLPDVPNARAISLEDAKTHTNFFEVLFTNKVTNVVYSASASIEQGKIEAMILPGNYDILLFAGAKDYLATYVPLLLASSYAQDATIILEESNVVNLVLATFEIDLIAPAKVLTGEDYSLSIFINTKNPLISNFSSGGFSSDIYYSGGMIDIPISGDDYIKDGNIYTYSTDLSAPLTTGTKIFDFHGYIWLSSSAWLYGTTAHPYFEQNFTKTIAFVEGADMAINISWPE